MDAKLKATIKLLEEVADSFAKRAEMYYKHRPKLMKLVEEFYRAYCTLAEQYDTVVDVLRQVLHTISDAFLRETPSPLTELDEPDLLTTSGTCSEHELQSDGSSNSLNKHTVKRSATFPEEKWCRTIVESSHLAKENDSLKEQLSSENSRANKAESEIAIISASIRQLSVARDAAEAECRAYSEKLEKVESELLKAQNDMKELADGWAREVGNLHNTEKIKQSQKQELEDLKERLRELEVRQLEPERNRSKQREEEGMQKISELMDEVERNKIEKETIVWQLKKEIERLNEQILSSEILISELDNKITMLIDTNERLESEIEILRERLWIYFGKQEKMIFATTMHAGADISASSDSFNWLHVLCNRLHYVLQPLKSHVGGFLFSLVKAVLYVYTKFFSAQNSSEKIIKEDYQCKSKLLMEVENMKNNAMQEKELDETRGEMDEDKMMSEEDGWRNSKTILENYKEET
jgi:DNA repair exonuclease SbcCD ATPase subunit